MAPSLNLSTRWFSCKNKTYSYYLLLKIGFEKKTRNILQKKCIEIIHNIHLQLATTYHK